MKKYIVGLLLLFFIPIWLALMFVFGENAMAYLLNSSSKNILSVKNINLPKIYIVESGSMEPAIKVGGVVIVSPDSLSPWRHMFPTILTEWGKTSSPTGSLANNSPTGSPENRFIR